MSNRIVYIFDTNIVESYLNTTQDNTEGTISFGHLFSDQTAVKVGHRLTIEFLLSGGLPGQRNAEAYLSAPHWNETLSRADRLANDIRRHASSSNVHQLKQLELISDPKDLISHAERIVPKEILKALGRAESVCRRLNLAFSDGHPKLRPLETTVYWTPAENQVRQKDFRRWQASLTKLRNASKAAKTRKGPGTAGSDGRSVHDERLKIESDAATLAGLEALYRENPEACTDGRNLLFLFVTADQAILSAVAQHERKLKLEGIPLFVRHPRVYSPILNFSNMARAISGEALGPDSVRGVFKAVERAIEQLFEFEYDERDFGGIGPARWIQRNLGRWEEAARQMVTVNAQYFAEDSEALQAVAERLSRPAALETASEMLRTTIGKIRLAHARLLSNEALDRLSADLGKLAAGNVTRRVRRAPVKIVGVNLLGDRLAEFVRESRPRESAHNLDQMLDDLVEKNATSEIAATIEGIREKLQDDWETPNGQLLASCIYLAIGAWQSARDCAERCKQLVRGPGNRSVTWREANYCKALALRFALRSQADFNDASNCLTTNISNWTFSKDANARLACLRDVIEHAALLGSASILQAIEDSAPFTNYGPDELPLEIVADRDIINNFDLSVAKMEEAVETLDLDYSGESDNQFLIEQLKVQLFINLAGAHVFRKLLGKKVSTEPFISSKLQEIVLRLDEVLGVGDRAVPPIAEVYRAIGRQLVQPDQLDRIGLIASIDEINAQLPYGDKVELNFLKEYLSSSTREGAFSSATKTAI